MGSPWTQPPEAIEGRWLGYRQIAGGGRGDAFPPLYYDSTPQLSGRWHRRGDGHAQYLALDVHGAWAELLRLNGERNYRNTRKYRRQLWCIVVDEARIADLSTFERYDACGLDPLLAVGDHGPAQELAASLVQAGYRGVLSPSAAMSGTVNLTLFGPRTERICATQPEALALRCADLLPAVHIADGSPPDSVVTSVVHSPRNHAGYLDYLAHRGDGRNGEFSVAARV